MTWLLHFDQSVRGLTPGSAVEFRGIRVGEVRDVRLEYDADTQRFRIPVLVDVEPERIARVEADPEGMERFVKENIAMGRFGTPEEVANVVAFVCSPRASWVTGACINIDGGQTKSNI